MSVDIRAKNARRQIDVFEDAWLQDHSEAMNCRDFEAELEMGVSVFDFVDHVYQTIRDQIYRGLLEASPESAEDEKSCYERWLKVANSLIDQLGRLENSFGVVEGASEFRERYELAHKRLSEWTPPTLARSMASRVWDISEEDAAMIKRLVDSPPNSPGRLNHVPRSLPPDDPKP
jgi:hypothetical protein